MRGGPVVDPGRLIPLPIIGLAIIGFLVGTIIGFSVGGIGGAILFGVIGTVGAFVAAVVLWTLGAWLYEARPFFFILGAGVIIVGIVAVVIYLLWGVAKPH